MATVIATDQSPSTSRNVFRALGNTPTVLPQSDYHKLQEHLEDCDNATRPGSTLLAYVLANKLLNVRPVADLPYLDLVLGGTEVTYVIDGAAPSTGLLVHTARPGTPGGVIAVASLLGATLIGMRVGERAPLLNQDGSIVTLSVISAVQPFCTAQKNGIFAQECLK